MDYLDHLGRVTNKKQRLKDIVKLEQELGYPLPKVLRIFYLLYQVNDLRQFKKHSHLDFTLRVWDVERSWPFSMALHVSPLRELGYDPQTFMDFENIKTVIANFFNDEWEELSKEYIVVAESMWQFPIMIGITPENSDKVFVFDMDKQEMVFVADNIFEYLMNIELDFTNNYGLPEGKTMNDLYRNWNEDFWRVKEDKEATE